ncbi:MAG: hypothetical protein AB8B91_06145 [Rubripirellula sp.]
MNHSNRHEDHTESTGVRSQGGHRALGGKSKAGGIAIIVLAVIYSLAAPKLNARYGWNLPQIRTDSSGNVRLAENAKSTTKHPAASSVESPRSDSPSSQAKASGASQSKSSPKAAEKTQPGSSQKTRGPLADRMRPSSRSSDAPGDSKSSTQPQASPADGDLLYGLLREVSSKRYVSPQGLLYTPGSAEGHRLEHLRRHTKDDPGRPGSHGVFDGEMEGALKTIDRAYERAKKNQRTTKREDRGRTIYTVDMGGRVGYVGGRDGNRKRKPMARRVQIVLEGTRVITAYPK